VGTRTGFSTISLKWLRCIGGIPPAPQKEEEAEEEEDEEEEEKREKEGENM
jgi:hypothetical protein